MDEKGLKTPVLLESPLPRGIDLNPLLSIANAKQPGNALRMQQCTGGSFYC